MNLNEIFLTDKELYLSPEEKRIENNLVQLIVNWVPQNEYQLVALVELLYQFEYDYDAIILDQMSNEDLHKAIKLLPGCNEFIQLELYRRAQEDKENDAMIRDIQNTY